MTKFLSLFLSLFLLVGCFSDTTASDKISGTDEAMGEAMGEASDTAIDEALTYINETYEKETGIAGLLTRVVYGNNVVYLFGSMHVGAPDWFPLHPVVYQGIDRADRFLFEYDIATDEVVVASVTMQHMLAEQNTIGHLFGELTEEEQTNFDQTIEDWLVLLKNNPPEGLPLPAAFISRGILDAITPFTLYTVAGLLIFETVDLSQVHGVDRYIMDQAEKRNRPIAGLIPVEEEIALMMNVPRAAQLWLLTHFPEPYDLAKEAHQLAALYQAQNIEGIEQVLSAQSMAENPLEAWLYQVVMVERSGKFADEIARLLREDTAQTLFVTLGIGHLIGNDSSSVLYLLRKQGFEVMSLF